MNESKEKEEGKKPPSEGRISHPRTRGKNGSKAQGRSKKASNSKSSVKQLAKDWDHVT